SCLRRWLRSYHCLCCLRAHLLVRARTSALRQVLAQRRGARRAARTRRQRGRGRVRRLRSRTMRRCLHLHPRLRHARLRPAQRQPVGHYDRDTTRARSQTKAPYRACRSSPRQRRSTTALTARRPHSSALSLAPSPLSRQQAARAYCSALCLRSLFARSLSATACSCLVLSPRLSSSAAVPRSALALPSQARLTVVLSLARALCSRRHTD